MNCRIICRDLGLGYRFNGFLSDENLFSGEIVFPQLRQGVTTHFVLAAGTYDHIAETVAEIDADTSKWVYQWVRGSGPQAKRHMVGPTNSEAIVKLHQLTRPLHQLALLQQSVLLPWQPQQAEKGDAAN